MTSTPEEQTYKDKIEAAYDAATCVTGDNVTSFLVPVTSNPDSIASVPIRLTGKVRDRYDLGSHRLALVTTDRQSGFDRMLALVPFKGQVLNLTSAYWFEQTADIIPNHLISIPHPNVSIVHTCKPFPVEFVVRAYMTGSTSTSIWKNYQNGVRNYCGHSLPEDMKKNEKLPYIMLTPTTKEETHDRPISAQEIIDSGLLSPQDWEVCSQAVLALFQRGQELAAQNGLILVDTKYELGKLCSNDQIVLIDEVHTPDSSRYWIASTYQERVDQGLEPENIDKEFLRLWFASQCDPYKDAILPAAPKDLVVELSRRYIMLYEKITGKKFNFGRNGNSDQAIANAIQSYL